MTEDQIDKLIDLARAVVPFLLGFFAMVIANRLGRR